MPKRITLAVLLVLLLFSRGASFLKVEICPHLASSTVSHVARTLRPEASHEHVEADLGESETAFYQSSDAKETPAPVMISQPPGSCAHCALHLRSSYITAALARSHTPRRASRFNAAFLGTPINCEYASAIHKFVSRAIGPSGTELPRHVLINVFRI